MRLLLSVFRLLWRDFRWRSLLPLPLMLGEMVLNSISIVTIIPMLSLVAGGDGAELGSIQRLFVAMFAFLHLPMSLPGLLGFLIGVFSLRAVIIGVKAFFIATLKTDLETRRKEELYGLLLASSPMRLARLDYGNLGHVIVHETLMMGQLVLHFGAMLSYLVNVLGYFVIVMWVSWKLTLVTGGLSVALYLGMQRVIAGARRSGHDIGAINGHIQHLVTQTLSGIKVIRGYGAESALMARLRGFMKRIRVLNVRLAVGESVFPNIFEPAVLCVVLFCYLLFRFEVTTFIVFLVALARMYRSFQQMQLSHYHLARYVGALDLYDRAAADLGVCQLADRAGEPSSGLKQALELVDLEHAYEDGEHFRLGPIDLRIERGQMVAFVGRSGGGKTTLVDMIMGFENPQKGRILLDGRPLDEQSLAAWRAHLAYVSQDTFLLNDTVRNNIRFFDERIDDARVAAAAEMAQARGFIDALPAGFETLVGEQGMRLSGGQKQRIALARALARQPDLLILDEGTSALDNESERLVQQAIDRLRGSLTIVLIAHRLSTVRGADVIHVVEDGRIVESGSYEALLARGEAFARMQGLAENEPLDRATGESEA